MEQTQSHTSASPAQHRQHPPVSVYLNIFKWLTAFTILELAISFIPADAIKIPALVFFAVLKAVLVVMYYMHLRYDRPLYTLILVIGVGFALLVGSFLPLMQK